MKYAKEIKIGAMLVITIGLSIWGYNFLKGKDIFSHQREFYTVYNKVEGLTVSSPVLINGYKIGYVQSMYFHPDQSGKVVVKMKINNMEFNVPKNSTAWLISVGLLGNKAIELILGDDMVYADDGDTLNNRIKSTITDDINKTVEPLKVHAIMLFSQMDSVLSDIRKIINKDTQENLGKSVRSLKETLANLESATGGLDTLVMEEKGKLKKILANFESISANFKNNNDKIANILTNFSAISDTLAKAQFASTLSNANKALGQANEVLQKINNGEGSIGLLINNDSLYNNLNLASHNLDALLADIKLNPHRYIHISVFGKKEKKEKKK